MLIEKKLSAYSQDISVMDTWSPRMMVRYGLSRVDSTGKIVSVWNFGDLQEVLDSVDSVESAELGEDNCVTADYTLTDGNGRDNIVPRELAPDPEFVAEILPSNSEKRMELYAESVLAGGEGGWMVPGNHAYEHLCKHGLSTEQAMLESGNRDFDYGDQQLEGDYLEGLRSTLEEEEMFADLPALESPTVIHLPLIPTLQEMFSTSSRESFTAWYTRCPGCQDGVKMRENLEGLRLSLPDDNVFDELPALESHDLGSDAHGSLQALSKQSLRCRLWKDGNQGVIEALHDYGYSRPYNVFFELNQNVLLLHLVVEKFRLSKRIHRDLFQILVQTFFREVVSHRGKLCYNPTTIRRIRYLVLHCLQEHSLQRGSHR